MGSVVDRALGLAEPQTDVVAARTRLRGLELERGRLLGVEAGAAAELDREIEGLRSVVAQAELGVSYRRLSAEVLSWRHRVVTKTEWSLRGIHAPKLALLSVDQPQVILASYGSVWFGHDLVRETRASDDLNAHYRDLFTRLSTLGSNGRLATLSYTYTGAIPTETRQKIQQAKTDFADQRGNPGTVFLLAETQPNNWLLERPTVRSRVRDWAADPLVVAYHHGALWLIDSYDTTPLEQYLATEFTS